MTALPSTNSPTGDSRDARHYDGVYPDRLPGSRPTAIPGIIRPQLASLGAKPPEDDRWLHEIKYDGYRTIAFIDQGRVRLITRNGYDWSGYYGWLTRAFLDLPCRQAILDGEVAVQDGAGSPTSPLCRGRSPSA